MHFGSGPRVRPVVGCCGRLAAVAKRGRLFQTPAGASKQAWSWGSPSLTSTCAFARSPSGSAQRRYRGRLDIDAVESGHPLSAPRCGRGAGSSGRVPVSYRNIRNAALSSLL
jgi:hypothetical protein